MWFAPVKKQFHPFLCVFEHTLNTGMLKPVHGGVFNERKFRQAVSGDIFVQVQ